MKFRLVVCFKAAIWSLHWQPNFTSTYHRAFSVILKLQTLQRFVYSSNQQPLAGYGVHGNIFTSLCVLDSIPGFSDSLILTMLLLTLPPVFQTKTMMWRYLEHVSDRKLQWTLRKCKQQKDYIAAVNSFRDEEWQNEISPRLRREPGSGVEARPRRRAALRHLAARQVPQVRPAQRAPAHPLTCRIPLAQRHLKSFFCREKN